MSTTAVTARDIQSADWSVLLDQNSSSAAPGSGIGLVAQGVNDINQALGIILTTPKGSDPLRPTFACDLWQWMDAPLTVARPNLVREIVEGVTIWEPRVRLLSVIVDLAPGTLSNLLINIVWQLAVDIPNIGNQQLILSVPRNLV